MQSENVPQGLDEDLEIQSFAIWAINSLIIFAAKNMLP